LIGSALVGGHRKQLVKSGVTAPAISVLILTVIDCDRQNMETITNSLFSVDLLNQPGADLMLAFATKILAGILTIIIGFWLAGRASRLVVDSISKIDRIDKTIMPMIGALVRYAGMILTLVVALGKFGVETTSIIAVLGAAGLAIGLALQGTLSNVAAGLMLVFCGHLNLATGLKRLACQALFVKSGFSPQ
jgi:small-conductance mechanosensitive channel